MGSYEETVEYAVSHGGRVGPQIGNPKLDHIWDIREDGRTACGSWMKWAGASRAGALCSNCIKVLERFKKEAK